MRWKIFVLAAISTMTAINGLLKADTFTGTFDAISPGEIVTVSGTSQWAGQTLWDDQGGGTSYTYCAQFYGSIRQGSTFSFDMVPLQDTPELSTSGLSSDVIAKTIMIECAMGSGPSNPDADQAAAMQVAIWKILDDYSAANPDWADPSTGSITWDTGSTWASDALAYLGYAVDPIGAVPVEGLLETAGGQSQSGLAVDFMQGPDPQPMNFPGAAPAPSVFWSLACLLGMCGLATRIRARKLPV